MSYQLRLNGKIWKTINGKTIRNLIYNDTVYEIAQPTKWPGYLTFSSDQSFRLTVTTNASYDGSLEYSTNITSWTEVTKGTAISSVDNKIYLRGSGNTYCKNSSSAGYVFSLTGSNIKCEGNIETLLDHQTVLNGEHPIMAAHCYQYLFNSCSQLIQAPELPATTLVDYCYYGMFSGCSNLTTAPQLPATTLASNCYNIMFLSCNKLTQAPQLPATTLADYCYKGMFQSCSKLTTAPALPAITLATSCYEKMFWACSSLIIAPKLPATRLAEYCYDSMFYGCGNLTQAPELPATTLANNCYRLMFQGCQSLTIVPALPATTLANRCYEQMFSNCQSLTTVPPLPATKLIDYCYKEMFNGCSLIKFATTQSEQYSNGYRIPHGTASGTSATGAMTYMFSWTGGSFTGTPSINTTYYTSNELVYGLTIQVNDSEKDYIQILSDIPVSITTNQTIRLRVRTTSNSISYSSTEQTDITKEWICKADDGSYHEYDLIISNPTGFETIQIRHSSVPSPTPF